MSRLLLSMDRDDPIHFYIDNVRIATISPSDKNFRQVCIEAEPRIVIIREKLLRKMQASKQENFK